ncbi:hypothetical protein GCM10010121_087270 [Streptomyces brasiliensis]|uniref:Uncharacterized protein n=1 Tax=Streptomyces brasiliensis TaxID=1954 RepID=A0A917P634_9ACTN|nr:hypothetical protein GCM10010121_087270 [Streptomyces brasiliensis]
MLDGQRVSAGFATFLHDRTEGLPLALEECVRLLRDRDELMWRDGEFGRFPVGGNLPTWLRHPSLTGLEPPAFDDLVARYRDYCTQHPTVLLPGKRPDGGPGAGTRRLSAADHLVVFLLQKRWSISHSATRCPPAASP